MFPKSGVKFCRPLEKDNRFSSRCPQAFHQLHSVWFVFDMVIECPACKTRFAIDAQQLSGVNSPRFHCSRCNHVFEYRQEEASANGEGSPTASDEKASAPASFESSASDVEYGSLVASAEPEQLDLLPAQSVEGGRRQSIIRGLPNEDFTEDDYPAIKADWPDTSGARPFEVNLGSFRASGSQPHSSGTAHSLSPKHNPASAAADMPPTSSWVIAGPADPSADLPEDARQEWTENYQADDEINPPAVGDTEEGEDFELIDEAGEDDWEEDDFNQTNEDPGATDVAGPSRISSSVEQGDPPKHDYITSERRQLQRDAYRQTLAIALEEERAAEESVPMPAAVEEPSPGDHQEGRAFSGPAAVLAALIGPVLLVACFWIWAQHIDWSPSILKEVFQLEPRGLPVVPPPGLVLIDARSRVVSLDNGKKVLEVQGFLLNATLKSYTNAQLEARIFDEQNVVIHQKVTSLNNALISAHLNALSEDAIDKLQDTPSSQEQLIKPNDRLPFRIVFTSLIGKEAWFSARVFEVLPR